MAGPASYTFGSDAAAEQRLALVAEAYEPVSSVFIASQGAAPGPTVLDLGCGPGFSTELLGRILAPARLVGVDESERFVTTARVRVPRARFEVHDVTEVPLPAAPADLMYARLLLSHLPDPIGVVARWRTQLAPGGMLLVEDLEEIEAPPGPLRHYDEVSAARVHAGGGLMYAGPVLASLGGMCTPVTVPAATAARIYLFNVRRWMAELDTAGSPGGDPRAQLADLERGLVELAGDDGAATVSWIVRQIVLRS